MAKGAYISINSVKIGEASAAANQIGIRFLDQKDVLKELQKKLSASQNLLEDHYGICFDDVIPTGRLSEQQKTISKIIEYLGTAAWLAEQTTNGLNTQSQSLQLAIHTMNYAGAAAYQTALSAIAGIIAGGGECGDDYAYVGSWASPPVAETFVINSPYGPRKLYGNFHYGIDLNCPSGTELRSVVGVTVISTETQSSGGKCIYILGDDGYVYEFAHLSTRNIKKGARVEAGDLIGWTGNTGTASTGAHLHFGIYEASQCVTSNNKLKWTNGMLKGSVDPEKFMAEQYGITYQRKKK